MASICNAAGALFAEITRRAAHLREPSHSVNRPWARHRPRAVAPGTEFAGLRSRDFRRSAVTKLDAEHRNAIDSKQFAFPKERKEPLENASHVRNAIARFNQVEGVGDAERDEAWKLIKAAAKKFGVEVNEKSWREIGKR
jgi:hypothetical protein